MEVVLDNGSISCQVTDVLEIWKKDYSSLFSNSRHTASSCVNHVRTVNSQEHNALYFDSTIDVMEVKKAIDDAKNGKACRVDELPAEVLKMMLHY